MESLHQLIQSLTPAEVKGVRAELKIRKTEMKLLELFEQYIELPSAVDIYPTFSNTSSLTERLYKRILEYIVSEKNLKETKWSGPVEEAMVRIRKNMLLLSFLMSTKKKYILYYDLLDETINLCKKFERYETLLTLLRAKRVRIGLRNGLEEFRAYKEQIRYYEECNAAVERAVELYYELSIIRNLTKRINDKELEVFISKALSDLRHFKSSVKSETLDYYIMYFEIDYADLTGDFKKSISIGLKKLELILKSSALYNEDRIGICWNDVAVSKINARQYTEAISYSEEGIKLFKVDSYNYYTAIQVRFLALFYARKYTEAFKLIESISIDSVIDNPTRQAMFTIYNAFSRFKLNLYKEVINIINQPLEISSDKTGWDIAVRVLTIMTLVELGRHEEAALHIDKLRKHVERYSKKDHITTRNEIITHALRTLARYEFDFSHSSLNKYLRQLQDPANAWKPLTPELIPFEEWVSGKR